VGKKFFLFSVSLLSVVIFLPENLPVRLGIDRIAWEVFYNLRYYYGLCAWKNPAFIYAPFSHPVPTLLSLPVFRLFIFLPAWKQITIFNLTILLLSAYLLWKSCKKICGESLGPFTIFVLIILQPVFLFWLTAFQGYFPGVLFLSLGIYFYLASEKWWGILFFGLLPLCRHELSVFLVAPFIISLKRREGIKGPALLFAPFILYYFVVSLVVWHNPFTLFFIHKITEVKCSRSVLGYFAPFSLTPFLYYGPVLWFFPFIYLHLRKKRFLFYLALNSLFLLSVSYLSRIIIPLFVLSLLGVSFFTAKISKWFRIGILVAVVIFQILWITMRNWHVEGGDSVYSYKDYSESYHCLLKMFNNYDYFLFPNRTSFVVISDKNCELARKLIVPQFRACESKGKITFVLPGQALITDRKSLRKLLLQKRIYTVVDKSYLIRKHPENFKIVKMCKQGFIGRLILLPVLP